MQRVERFRPNVSPIMDGIDNLYTILSDKPSVALVKPVFDESFRSLVDVFCERGKHHWEVEYNKQDYKQIEPIKNKEMILTFSGGKDSIATALKYRDLGYNVHLYHMRHVNPSLADEWKSAQAVAELLDMPIYFDDIRFTGYHMYMEHPMKNMLIANGALSYGVREGITTNIAFGNYTNSFLDDNVFERCAGDCMDMWETYDTIIQRVIPDFKIQAVVEHLGETLNMLIDRDDLLNASMSCLCRHSLREYRRQWVKDKYGVDLFQMRCGSCYKCCAEYIYMADHGKLKYSEGYYKYCLGQLLKVMRAEKIPAYDAVDIWDAFMFYDIDESKIADQIENAEVLKNTIKWK